jgi:choline monooxygenase
MSDLRPTLPASSYHGDAAWRRDRDALIGPGAFVVAHVDEIPNPGDVSVFEIAGWRLLVVRGDDGEIRVFHDTCRHRAGPIVGATGGAEVGPRGLRQLRCQYHGWCYRLDGTLAATPQFGAEVTGLNLVACASRVWRGLVFASPTGTLSGSDGGLDAVLDGLGRVFDGVDFTAFRFVSRRSHTLRCDWKVYVENYLEGYHIPVVHPGLAREVRLADYYVRCDGPVVEHLATPRRADGRNAGRWAWAWPALAINGYVGGYNVERVVPVAPSETRVDYLYLFHPSISGEDAARTIAMSEEVTAEDRHIVEAVQRNLEGGAVPTGVLSPRHEAGVAAFHDLCRRGWG